MAGLAPVAGTGTSEKLNYWKSSWPLRWRQCPCDVHFLEYLKENRITGRVIFHFGTGSHHIVGRTNAEAPEPNEVFGITASRREYLAYINYIIANPRSAVYYKAVFADVYTLTPGMLPRFDLVTLFHLCEFYDRSKSAYAPLDDEGLIDLFLDRLNPGGRILFYKFSGKGNDKKARAILTRAVRAGKLIPDGEYQSLLIYRAGTEARD